MKAFTDLRLKSLILTGCVLLGYEMNFNFSALAGRSPATVVSDPRNGWDAGTHMAKRDPATVVTDPGNGADAGPHKGSAACPIVNPVLTALVPTYKNPSGTLSKEDETLEERPTIWLYIPYALNQVPGELQVQQPNGIGGMSYQTVSTVTGTQPGIVGVRLPATVQMKENQRLNWRFVVICDRNDPTANPTTRATIVRRAKSPALAQQLQSATPAQLVALYGKEGVWYDVLNRLTTLRQQNPNDANAVKSWKALLGQGGLSVFDSKQPSQRTPYQ